MAADNLRELASDRSVRAKGPTLEFTPTDSRRGMAKSFDERERRIAVYTILATFRRPLTWHRDYDGPAAGERLAAEISCGRAA